MARTPNIVEDRREQIIDAAMLVFAQKGFSRATNKDIARAAGITPGLIYHYFENKEALLMALIEARSPLRLLRALPEDVFEQPPAFFLRFLVQQVLGIIENERFIPLIRVLLPELLHNPAITPMGSGVLHQVVNFLEHYFSLQITAGALREADAALVTQVFMGSMMGFVLRRQILRDPALQHYTHEQVADSIVDLVLNGLLPR